MNLDLTGKTALVCGSSQGIGKASAIEIAKLGANVVLAARNKEKLQMVCDSLDTTLGQQHHFLAVDFLNIGKLKEEVELILKQNPIHILVNNTGGPPAGLISTAGPGALLEAFHMHLIVNHMLANLCVPSMKNGYGRIINIVSTTAKEPQLNLGISNTIRGAVVNWAKSMSNELAQFGITVNNILPGATKTERHDSLMLKMAEQAGTTVVEAEELDMVEIPAGRYASPSEIGNVVAFLASPAASYINGINLPVDGGRTRSL